MKLNFVYSLTKLNNTTYGQEITNSYRLSYELSDWSDLNLSLKKINKDNRLLDRESLNLRYGKINPDANTEMSFEFMQNVLQEYKERYSVFKYSIFY